MSSKQTWDFVKKNLRRDKYITDSSFSLILFNTNYNFDFWIKWYALQFSDALLDLQTNSIYKCLSIYKDSNKLHQPSVIWSIPDILSYVLDALPCEHWNNCLVEFQFFISTIMRHASLLLFVLSVSLALIRRFYALSKWTWNSTCIKANLHYEALLKKIIL